MRTMRSLVRQRGPAARGRAGAIPLRRVLLVLAAACILCMHLPHLAAADVDGMACAPSGEYATKRTSLDFNVSSASTGCEGQQCRLRIDITYPMPTPAPPDSAPVVVFFSGFQAQSSYYHYLATALAAHGYVVVQYQTTATLGDFIWRCLHPGFGSCNLGNITDALELKFLAPVLEYSQRYAKTTLGLTFADFDSIALMGHSRGGKLAALHYADGDPRYKAAPLLLDPVDATYWSPVGKKYPSALDKLAARPRPLAIVGAGVGWNLGLFSCNPATSNSTQFAKVAAAGSSYYAILPQTGHMNFIQASPVVELVFNGLCQWGTRTVPNEVARNVTVAIAVAWANSQLRAGPPPDAPGSALCAKVHELGPKQMQLQKKAADGSWQATCVSRMQPT